MKVQINDRVKKFDKNYMTKIVMLEICGLALIVGAVMFGQVAFVVASLGTVGAVMMAWPLLSLSRVERMATKNLEQAVQENGVQPLYTFDTRGKMMIIDAENQNIVMSYRSNPKEVSIISMDRVTDLRVNNWAMAGMTRCVSADFRIDGKKERIMTFSANHNCLLSHPKVVSGLDKANTIIEIIEGTQTLQMG